MHIQMPLRVYLTGVTRGGKENNGRPMSGTRNVLRITGPDILVESIGRLPQITTRSSFAALVG